jgi:hypothetical protein
MDKMPACRRKSHPSALSPDHEGIGRMGSKYFSATNFLVDKLIF